MKPDYLMLKILGRLSKGPMMLGDLLEDEEFGFLGMFHGLPEIVLKQLKCDRLVSQYASRVRITDSGKKRLDKLKIAHVAAAKRHQNLLTLINSPRESGDEVRAWIAEYLELGQDWHIGKEDLE